jgi:hypothetical protein
MMRDAAVANPTAAMDSQFWGFFVCPLRQRPTGGRSSPTAHLVMHSLKIGIGTNPALCTKPYNECPASLTTNGCVLLDGFVIALHSPAESETEARLA